MWACGVGGRDKQAEDYLTIVNRDRIKEDTKMCQLVQ